MHINGTTVLLTGATGGIGQAIAEDLSAQGAHLILTGRQGDVLDRLADELGGRALQVDLADAAQVTRLIGEAVDADILVANAGVPASGRLDSYSAAEIDRALEVNLRAPIVLANGLAAHMIERRAGHIVFLSSLSGKVASPNTSLYNATKFGLRGFSHSLRAELRGDGVGVSVVCPGFISDAGMFADADVKLPPGLGTRTPQQVARAVRRAIEHNKAEIDVAPGTVRAGAILAGVAPGLSARVTRLVGGEKVAHALADAQQRLR
jgi:short-subunit dehydrogenase